MSQNTTEKSNYPESIRNNKCAIAFYDNLGEFISGLIKENDVLEEVVIKVNKIFNEVSKKPDWTNNSDVTNQIEGQIEDILWDLEDEYDIQFENSDEIIGRIRNIGINNYS